MKDLIKKCIYVTAHHFSSLRYHLKVVVVTSWADFCNDVIPRSCLGGGDVPACPAVAWTGRKKGPAEGEAERCFLSSWYRQRHWKPFLVE